MAPATGSRSRRQWEDGVRSRATSRGCLLDRAAWLTCVDGGASRRADMVSRCLHCRHATEIYVRFTVSTGANSSDAICNLQSARRATCTFGMLPGC
jgi:hypothetical protein